jgi:hypothetical protein
MDAGPEVRIRLPPPESPQTLGPSRRRRRINEFGNIFHRAAPQHPVAFGDSRIVNLYRDL